MQFPDGTRVKDIFVGRKTSFLYTKYCRGIKLIEARQYSYDRRKRLIKFEYPFSIEKTRSPVLWICVTVTENIDYEKLLASVLESDKVKIKPVLLFAKWESRGTGKITAEISNSKQMVPL